MKDFVEIAHGYARDVLAGTIPACKWVRLACERHQRDMARQGSDDFPFVFNPELQDIHRRRTYRPVQRVCGFAELMPHIKGDWAARGQRISLEPWQVFILASVFGWVHVETGKRRFRKVDIFVPRKNAKSTIASVIGLYMLGFDGEHGAEVYSGATSRDQAHEVFGPARKMAQANPDYRATCSVIVNVSNLAVLETNGKFEPVIGKPGDGASPSCAIVDEYHEHATSELYDTMWTGMGARSQPLLLMITTAGANIGGPCYAHQVELQKVLESGGALDERRFGLIYTIDAGDDWSDPTALYKANPNLGVSIDTEKMLLDQDEAKRDPRKQTVFKTKHLDVWVGAASPWLNVDALQRLGDLDLREESFRGETCDIGLDLASKNDIASKAKLFRRQIEGEWHYYLFSRHWLPEATVNKPENEHYRGWVASGHIVQTPGNMIDLRQIQESVEADSEMHLVHEVPMDAWGSREIAPALQQSGYTVIDVPMTTRNLSEPMKLIAALVDAGRFHHDGNPATVWMFSNVEVEPDRNDNIFPRKAKRENKIDAAVATTLAMGRSMLGAEAAGSFDDYLNQPIST
ncbi:MAG: terminase large subunit [Variovorax sp.]|nr:terminase large subunit [Variovorax sp.]